MTALPVSPPRLVVVAAGSCIEIVRGGARLSLVGEEARRIAAEHAHLATISGHAAEAFLIGVLAGLKYAHAEWTAELDDLRRVILGEAEPAPPPAAPVEMAPLLPPPVLARPGETLAAAAAAFTARRRGEWRRW